MSLSSPSSSLFVQLVSEKKKRNIKLCIICQCRKDVKGSTKLTGPPEGRNHVILTPRTLQDEFLFGLTDADLLNIKYHVKSFYARGQGKDTLKHELPINEKLLLKVHHLVLQVN